MRASQVGRIDESIACWRELGHERVPEVMNLRLDRVGGREVSGWLFRLRR